MAIHAEDSVVFTWRPFRLFLPLVSCRKKNTHTFVILEPYEIINMIHFFFFVLGCHYPLFLEFVADEKEKCLRLFLFSNILLFRYQLILILKIIASYYMYACKYEPSRNAFEWKESW